MMKRLFAVLVVVATGSAFAAQNTPPPATPEDAIKAFVAALQNKDFASAAKLIKGVKPGADYTDLEKKMYGGPITLELRDLKSAVKPTKAQVSFRLIVTTGDGQKQESKVEKVQLVREKGVWLIQPPKEPVPGMAIGALAWVLADPQGANEKAKAAAQQTLCISHLKQLCLAFYMFAADNDDLFPPKAEAWKPAIAEYYKDAGIITCPLDPVGAMSYTMNPKLAGISTSAIAAPEKTVLLYEGKGRVLLFRHRGKAGVGFADGSVKMVTPEQAKSLRWNP